MNALALKKKIGKRLKAKACKPAAGALQPVQIIKPSKERDQHMGGVVRDVPLDPNAQIMGYRVRCECQLDVYLARLQIDPFEHQAGMRFRRAWLRHARGINVADSTERTGQLVDCAGDGDGALLDVSASQKAVREALEILPANQRAVVVGVCGEDEFAGGTRRITLLRRGLEAIARFWGII